MVLTEHEQWEHRTKKHAKFPVYESLSMHQTPSTQGAASRSLGWETPQAAGLREIPHKSKWTLFQFEWRGCTSSGSFQLRSLRPVWYSSGTHWEKIYPVRDCLHWGWGIESAMLWANLTEARYENTKAIHYLRIDTLVVSVCRCIDRPKSIIWGQCKLGFFHEA